MLRMIRGRDKSGARKQNPKLVCPMGLTFDLTSPVADGVDNQWNLSLPYTHIHMHALNRMKGVAVNGYRPHFTSFIYN